MAHLLIRHKIEDFDRWKPHFDEHGATRRACGAHGSRIFRNTADPCEVMILSAWDDLDRARLFSQSDDLQEAMGRSGVIDRPDLWILEEFDQTVGWSAPGPRFGLGGR